MEDVAYWEAYRVGGVSSQKGMAVLRPAYFAFLPSEAKVNQIGKLAGVVANEVAGQALGVTWVSAEAKMPVDLLLQVMVEATPNRLTATFVRLSNS